MSFFLPIKSIIPYYIFALLNIIISITAFKFMPDYMSIKLTTNDTMHRFVTLSFLPIISTLGVFILKSNKTYQTRLLAIGIVIIPFLSNIIIILMNLS